jgi:hypothetical protein
LDEESWLLAGMGKKGGAEKLTVASWPTKSLTKQTNNQPNNSVAINPTVLQSSHLNPVNAD